MPSTGLLLLPTPKRCPNGCGQRLSPPARCAVAELAERRFGDSGCREPDLNMQVVQEPQTAVLATPGWPARRFDYVCMYGVCMYSVHTYIHTYSGRQKI